MLIGKGKYTGWLNVTYEILPAVPEIYLSSDSFTYTGKTITPSVKVTMDEKEVPTTNYEVIYDEGRKDVRTYEVTVNLFNDNTTSNKAFFDINPKGTKITSLKRSGKNLIIKWKRQALKMSKTRITGYQVELATNKAFTKNMKRYSQRGFKKALRTISNLKENKKYFVRVRTYKTINEKKYFSNWSRGRRG